LGFHGAPTVRAVRAEAGGAELRHEDGGVLGRVVFAEGEEEQVIRAAASFVHQGLGTALLVGRERRVRDSAEALGVELGGGIEIINAAMTKRNANYAAYLYERLQRQGYLQRDCQRMVNQDRNHFAACMVALGDADAMVTGVTRNFSVALADVQRVIDPKRLDEIEKRPRDGGFDAVVPDVRVRHHDDLEPV